MFRATFRSLQLPLRQLVRSKATIDLSKVPTLSESDLEEKFTRGNGPGGQSVQKNSNCCTLRHKPTGIVVKCHMHRSLDANRKEARELLITKLDNLQNGEDSVEAQRQRIERKKFLNTERKKRKMAELKQKWKDEQKKSE